MNCAPSARRNCKWPKLRPGKLYQLLYLASRVNHPRPGAVTLAPDPTNAFMMEFDMLVAVGPFPSAP